MKRIIVVLLLALGFGIAMPGVAQARGIRAHCGMHLGKLYRIDSGGAKYHVRFGPKRGHVGGSHHCRGRFFIRSGKAKATTTINGLTGFWSDFNWLRWHASEIMAVNGTAASCVGFGIALAGEAPTGAVDTWLTASAMAGCAGGSGTIIHNLLGDGNGLDYCGATANHPVCNARVGMR